MEPLAIPCPFGLAERGFRLERETADHLPFLRQLFYSLRGPESRFLPFPEEQRLAFLEQQFQLQYHQYHTAYPDPSHLILTAPSGPAGLLYLASAETDRGSGLRLVNFLIHEDFRGQGLGQALLAEVQRLKQPVILNVEKQNPAQRLYHRMGFAPYGDNGLSWAMIWLPARTAGAAELSL